MYSRGLIEAIGYDADIKAAYHSATFDDVIDATDKCVIPGMHELNPFIFLHLPIYIGLHLGRSR